MIEATGAALARGSVADLPGLHERRVQVKIVGHHRRAQHSDGYVETLAAQMGHYAGQHLGGNRLGEPNLNTEASRHYGNERQDEGFDEADPHALKPQQQQCIGGGEQDSEQQRDMK